jgi:hypothetical protein
MRDQDEARRFSTNPSQHHRFRRDSTTSNASFYSDVEMAQDEVRSFRSFLMIARAQILLLSRYLRGRHLRVYHRALLPPITDAVRGLILLPVGHSANRKSTMRESMPMNVTVRFLMTIVLILKPLNMSAGKVRRSPILF